MSGLSFSLSAASLTVNNSLTCPGSAGASRVRAQQGDRTMNDDYDEIVDAIYQRQQEVAAEEARLDELQSRVESMRDEIARLEELLAEVGGEFA